MLNSCSPAALLQYFSVTARAQGCLVVQNRALRQYDHLLNLWLKVGSTCETKNILGFVQNWSGIPPKNCYLENDDRPLGSTNPLLVPWGLESSCATGAVLRQVAMVCSNMVSIFTRSASLWNHRPRICCFLRCQTAFNWKLARGERLQVNITNITDTGVSRA